MAETFQDLLILEFNKRSQFKMKKLQTENARSFNLMKTKTKSTFRE